MKSMKPLKWQSCWLIVLELLFIGKNAGLSQKVDTIIKAQGPYENINIDFYSGELAYFLTEEIDINIVEGEITKNRNSRDTFGIRKLNKSVDTLEFEIILSDKYWRKAVLGSKCNHIGNMWKQLPTINIRKYPFSDTLYIKPDFALEEFIIQNYQAQIKCNTDLNDDFMNNYLERWITMIENGGLTIVGQGILSPIYQFFGTESYLTPKKPHDTLVYTLKFTAPELSTEFSYLSTYSIDSDSFKIHYITDKVDGNETFMEDMALKLGGMFSEFQDEDEKLLNEKIMNSYKNEDKTILTIYPNNKIKKYIRIIESQRLDSSLKLNYSFYNYKIEKL